MGRTPGRVILHLHLEISVGVCQLRGNILGGGRACQRWDQSKSEGTAEGPACWSEPETEGPRETQVTKLAKADGLGLVHQGGWVSSSKKRVSRMIPVSDADITHRKILSLLLNVWTKKSKMLVWLWQSEKLLRVIRHVD